MVLIDEKRVFSNNLKYLRKKFNLRQKDLSSFLNCHSQTISNWELIDKNSVPKLKHLIFLKYIFNIDIEIIIKNLISKYDYSLSLNKNFNINIKFLLSRFSKNINYFRNLKNISQVELANYLGCDQATISKWETPSNKHHPSLKELITLSEILDIDRIDDLIENDYDYSLI